MVSFIGFTRTELNNDMGLERFCHCKVVSHYLCARFPVLYSNDVKYYILNNYNI